MRARIKVEGEVAWYHVHARIAGGKRNFRLHNKRCVKRLINMLRFYSKAYCCELAAFCIMGNHYHLVLRFEPFRKMTADELFQRALLLYPDPESKKLIKNWPQEKWERLEKRLFDLSEFMRNVQGSYARWYNHAFDRYGRFWAGPFKSTVLETGNAIIDCMLYVDLNPIRAGITQRPENYEGSSFFLRYIQKDHWLISLTDISEIQNRQEALADYRHRLYYRGATPSNENQAAIPQEIVEEEVRRGVNKAGAYTKRLRYFTDGLALGSEEFIRCHLAYLREMGQYQRRKHPVKCQESLYQCLREQRKHVTPF